MLISYRALFLMLLIKIKFYILSSKLRVHKTKNGVPVSTCFRSVLTTAFNKNGRGTLRTDSSTVHKRMFRGSVPLNL
jgi:hypothetical protein